MNPEEFKISLTPLVESKRPDFVPKLVLPSLKSGTSEGVSGTLIGSDIQVSIVKMPISVCDVWSNADDSPRETETMSLTVYDGET